MGFAVTSGASGSWRTFAAVAMLLRASDKKFAPLVATTEAPAGGSSIYPLPSLEGGGPQGSEPGWLCCADLMDRDYDAALEAEGRKAWRKFRPEKIAG